MLYLRAQKQFIIVWAPKTTAMDVMGYRSEGLPRVGELYPRVGEHVLLATSRDNNASPANIHLARKISRIHNNDIMIWAIIILCQPGWDVFLKVLHITHFYLNRLGENRVVFVVLSWPQIMLQIIANHIYLLEKIRNKSGVENFMNLLHKNWRFTFTEIAQSIEIPHHILMNI